MGELRFEISNLQGTYLRDMDHLSTRLIQDYLSSLSIRLPVT